MMNEGAIKKTTSIKKRGNDAGVFLPKVLSIKINDSVEISR